MELYRKLSKISFLKKSYAYKFLFVTFIGIHIPLIGLLFYVLFGQQSVSTHSIMIFTLVMTLLATAVTLLVLKRLIKPIEIASKALNNYRDNRILSDLPMDFQDEAGLLLRNIQKSVTDNEKYIIDKQDLVYLLSHDLRAFTGNTQSLARLILDEKPSELIKEYAELICESTQQQFVFIETFIQLIKEEEEISKKTVDLKKIQLESVLAVVAEQVVQKLAAKKIKLVTSVEVDIAFLKIEPDLLIRVLVNLIDNAIKFSFPESEIKVRVYVKDGELAFVVSDSGLGFDSNYENELFEKFTNRGRLGTANEPSTGIGLYLCKKIVEKHEGRLLAQSDGVNQGASFLVFLKM